MILDPPLIDPKYLTHPDDIKTIVKAIEVIIELIENTPELKEYGMDLPIGNDFKSVRFFTIDGVNEFYLPKKSRKKS